MDVALQKHGAKHIYRVPEGLRELCADISREVLRAQPSQIYCFIADYVDALLITRENAKVAVRVVHNILLGSESIMGILHQSGLNLEQIAVAATRIQKAFRTYLDLVDVHHAGLHENDEKLINSTERIDENSRICIRKILESTGTSWEEAEMAASTIQAAFRNHYKEMLAREARGEVQWQRAVVNTVAILRRAGVSQEEAARAATLIQSAYRGYYTRRNVKLNILSGAGETESIKENEDIAEPRETIQAVAWMDMMFEDSKHTMERVNEAATIIQSAYRGYRTRAIRYVNNVESSKSMVVEAILDNLRSRVWSKVKLIDKYPEEFGSRREMEETVDKIESEYKNRQRSIKLSEQLKEDEFEEFVESHAEEETVIEAATDPEVANEGDEDRVESVAQDPEEDKENSAVTMKSEAEAELVEEKEQQEAEPVIAIEPDVHHIESVHETETKDLQEEHKEHEEHEEHEEIVSSNKEEV